MDPRELEDRIAAQLTEAGISFKRHSTIGGLRPDFVVTGPKGEVIIVEAKAWDPRRGNTARALAQVNSYTKAVGADRAFLVLPELKKNFEAQGVVGLDGLLPSLLSFFEESVSRRAPHTPTARASKRIVFAAMPFEREYDDTYFVAMSYAADQVNAGCERTDHSEFSGDIVEQIERSIRASIAVIVDLSAAKPNVLYEAGLARALGKPTVHICSTPLLELPFDVRNWNTISYTLGQTARLREPLARRLRAVLQ